MKNKIARLLIITIEQDRTLDLLKQIRLGSRSYYVRLALDEYFKAHSPEIYKERHNID